MSFPSLQLTDAGRQIIVKALSGDCAIEFTKFGVGNGAAPASVSTLTDLVNLVKSININSLTSGDGCANLSGVLDNANLPNGFWWREVGIYATDPDAGEVLYAYAHAGEYAEYIPQYTNQSYLRTTLNVTVVVGDAENVSAIISEYVGYATTEQFEEHTGDHSNPHAVTKEQVGLGDVPNVPTNDQTPTFTESSSLATINSGEKLSVIMGKIKKAISSMISHFNSSNPHNITCSKIGAATSGHTHGVSDITSGVLPVNRGGTGQSSIGEAAFSMLSNALNYNSNTKIDPNIKNWNNLTTPGFYYVFYGETNHPPTDTNYFVFVVRTSRNCIDQIAISDDINTANIYRRSQIDTIWGSWH